MMGRPQKAAAKLFYTDFNLDERVGADNPLRAIHAAIDFDFVRPLVRPLYGVRGNESIDPALLLKLMFILFYEPVPSERALLARLSERLDWLWFCGMDLDSEVPNHSVISKARKRWGTQVFAEFFGRVLTQCVDANLVDGKRVHVDSSLVAADSAYGTGENYQQLREKDVRPAIPHPRQKGTPGKFGRDQFRYEAAEDCYVCPAGQKLRRTGSPPERDHVEYRAGTKVCAACGLQAQCTGKNGRTFKRHVLQDAIDWADHLLPPGVRRWMIRRRRIRAEGSFADALRHGFKRARWRGLAKMTIQNLLIAAIQNVRKLLKYARKGRGGTVLADNLLHLAKTLSTWSHRAVQWLTPTREDSEKLEFSYHA